jgi:hypothetical protein
VECTAKNGCGWERLTEGIEEAPLIVHHDGLHLHLGHVQQLHLDTISQPCVAFFLLGGQQSIAFSMLARPVRKTIWLKRVMSIDLKVPSIYQLVLPANASFPCWLTKTRILGALGALGAGLSGMIVSFNARNCLPSAVLENCSGMSSKSSNILGLGGPLQFFASLVDSLVDGMAIGN